MAEQPNGSSMLEKLLNLGMSARRLGGGGTNSQYPAFTPTPPPPPPAPVATPTPPVVASGGLADRPAMPQAPEEVPAPSQDSPKEMPSNDVSNQESPQLKRIRKVLEEMRGRNHPGNTLS